MSRQIQIRRGTAEENDEFTGAIGEITMDTTNNTLRVHDGQTLGGTTLAKQSDIPAPIPDTADYVIESQFPTPDNNYTWYRKYKSGWIEMGGGPIAITYQTATNITLPITMTDTNYVATVSQCSTSSNFAEATLLGATPISTTQIRITSRASSTAYDNTRFYWIVKGMCV